MTLVNEGQKSKTSPESPQSKGDATPTATTCERSKGQSLGGDKSSDVTSTKKGKREASVGVADHSLETGPSSDLKGNPEGSEVTSLHVPKPPSMLMEFDSQGEPATPPMETTPIQEQTTPILILAPPPGAGDDRRRERETTTPPLETTSAQDLTTPTIELATPTGPAPSLDDVVVVSEDSAVLKGPGASPPISSTLLNTSTVEARREGTYDTIHTLTLPGRACSWQCLEYCMATCRERYLGNKVMAFRGTAM